MKKLMAIMMLGTFLAGSVATVVAQDKPVTTKECKKDSTKCKKDAKCCKGQKDCCKKK